MTLIKKTFRANVVIEIEIEESQFEESRHILMSNIARGLNVDSKLFVEDAPASVSKFTYEVDQ